MQKKKKPIKPSDVKSAISADFEADNKRASYSGFYQSNYIDGPNTCTKAKWELAVKDLKCGKYCNAAVMWSNMLNDSSLAAVVNTRCLSLLQADLMVEPGDEEDEVSNNIKDFVNDNFHNMFPIGQLKTLLTWYLGVGTAIGELVWSLTDDNYWVPELKVWSMRLVTYDHDKKLFILEGKDGPIEVDPNEKNGKWLIISNYQPDILDCAVAALGKKYLFGQWNLNDWGRYNEKHGLPIIKGRMPPTASDNAKRQFTNDLSGISSARTIALPNNGTDVVYDFDMLESTDQAYQSFLNGKNSVEQDYYIYFLGQNLTTNVQGGSLAAASVHNDVRLDISKSDDKLLNSNIREQVLIPFTLINFTNDINKTPHFNYNLEQPSDLNEIASSYSALIPAIESIKAFMTKDDPEQTQELDTEELFTKFGIPLREKLKNKV